MGKCIVFALHLIYTEYMPAPSTTIRINPALHKKVLRQAKKMGLTFSDVVNLLLRAFVRGNLRIEVNQYSDDGKRIVQK